MRRSFSLLTLTALVLTACGRPIPAGISTGAPSLNQASVVRAAHCGPGPGYTGGNGAVKCKN